MQYDCSNLCGSELLAFEQCTGEVQRCGYFTEVAGDLCILTVDDTSKLVIHHLGNGVEVVVGKPAAIEVVEEWVVLIHVGDTNHRIG